MSNNIAAIADLLRPAVEALGVELWGVDQIEQGRSSIERTFVNGVCVYENGKVRADAPRGMRLTFDGNVR